MPRQKGRKAHFLNDTATLPPVEATVGALVPIPVQASRRLAPLSDEVLNLVAALNNDDTASNVNNKVALWPSTRTMTTSHKSLSTRVVSKAPLALQLEAFIRREHRQYILEHPGCTRVDTLHIFREALGAFVEHFPEYTGVLYLIRSEYDGAVSDMCEQVKHMKIVDLENKSDRSHHAMELMHLKESMNATISNQQAQLNAAQGLVHALREQLASAEHANSLLKFEMEKKLKEHEEAKGQVKLLSNAMVEESARTAHILEESKRKDKDMQLQAARIKVFKENIEELEEALRMLTTHNGLAPSCADDFASPGLGGGNRGAIFTSTFNRHRIKAKLSVRPHQVKTLEDSSAPQVIEAPPSNEADKERIRKLQERVDKLEFELASTKQDKLQKVLSSGLSATHSMPLLTYVPLGTMSESAAGTSPVTSTVAADGNEKTTQPNVQATLRTRVSFPVVREWLRHEGVGEAELDPFDYLLPPGVWPSEELAFLKTCHPVRNRHFALREILYLVNQFWEARDGEINRSSNRIQPFFMQWLMLKAGNLEAARELGMNMLHGCQHNLEVPDCRGLLCVLRGFLPEDLVFTWRRLITELLRRCQTIGLMDNKMLVSTFFKKVREVFPEKPSVHMLQLRFYVYRSEAPAPEMVNVVDLLAEKSYFVTLLKMQLMREVEGFTLAVVEGIRAVADSTRGTVLISAALRAMQEADPHITQEYLHTYLAEACQKTIMDISTAEDSAAVRLDPMLSRFRSFVLLRRSSPND